MSGGGNGGGNGGSVRDGGMFCPRNLLEGFRFLWCRYGGVEIEIRKRRMNLIYQRGIR